MSTFFNNLESYGLFLIYKMLIWTSRNIPNVGLFSAYAEVFPTACRLNLPASSFLCLRRGVSNPPGVGRTVVCFSLPTQRCFLQLDNLQSVLRLFSAYAEVFLMSFHLRVVSSAFLCLRRGVSIDSCPRHGDRVFSLPTQRCFSVPDPA